MKPEVPSTVLKAPTLEHFRNPFHQSYGTRSSNDSSDLIQSSDGAASIDPNSLKQIISNYQDQFK